MSRDLLLCLLGLAVFGCDDSPSPRAEPISPPPAPVEPSPPPLRAAKDVNEYRALCEGGEPFTAAKPYALGATSADISRIAAFAKYVESATPEWSRLTGEPIAAWSAEEPEDVQLVACVGLSKRALRRSCDYKDSADQPIKLELYDMSHAVRVVEAATGKVVLEQTFELQGDVACPAFGVFGSSNDFRGVDYEHKLMAVFAPLQPDGARPPRPSSASELSLVCNGVAFPGTTPYDKGAAQKHPLHEVFRPDESEPFSSGDSPEGFGEVGERLDDAAAYQLVACATGKATKKRKECRFQDGAVLELHEGTMDVSVYATATAELVEKKTFKVSGGSCPIMYRFSGDSKREVWLAKLEPAYKKYMAALVGG